MTRKKVRLVWIANDVARKASLKKRRQGITKKVSELTILCDVPACLIIYSPDEVEPLVWPSHEVAQDLIQRFFNLPDIERSKKTVNQETYLRDRAGKVHDQLNKSQRKNKEVEIDHLLQQLQSGRTLDDLCLSEMYGLTWFCKEKMKEICKRLDFFQHVPLPGPSPQLPGEKVLSQSLMFKNLSYGMVDSNNDSYMVDQWISDGERGNNNIRGDDDNDKENDGSNDNSHNGIKVKIGDPSVGGAHRDQIGLDLNMTLYNMNMSFNHQNLKDLGLYLKYGDFLSGQSSGSDVIGMGICASHPNNLNNITNMSLGLQSQGNFDTQGIGHISTVDGSKLVGHELTPQLYDGRGSVVGPNLGLLLHGIGDEVGLGIFEGKRSIIGLPRNPSGVKLGPSNHGMLSTNREGESNLRLPFGLFGGTSNHMDAPRDGVNENYPQGPQTKLSP